MASSTGLLVVSNVKQIVNTLKLIEKHVESLYVHLNIPNSVAKTVPPPAWGRLVSQLYVDSSSYCAHYTPSGKKGIDMRILISPLKLPDLTKLQLQRPIDLIFADCLHSVEICRNLRQQLNISSEPIYLNADYSQDISVPLQEDASKWKMYDNVVLGGTFDRIHLGHKIFLSQAVIRAKKRLVVGVTMANMTKGKTLPEFILPVEERISEVQKFLRDIDATVQYEVVPIDDPFGPTKSDPNMDMIVVSAETLKGGHKVNEVRTKNMLRPLEIFSIDIVESSVDEGPKETKVSSSNTRIDMLGTRLRTPEPRPHLNSKKPYIVGLTGSIASGKSKMAQRFGNMGATVLDCDKIAHEIYAPGQVCYTKIINHFGRKILANDGSIDRSKLGPIVFADPKQLDALNAIVWPEIMLEAKRRIASMPASVKVVILEAAVLLKANWETECHEVWSMIVPPEEALRRVMERNGLSEENARQRLASQLDNFEIVRRSHVVFSSQWESAFTLRQAEKAWQMLMNELSHTAANL